MKIIFSIFTILIGTLAALVGGASAQQAIFNVPSDVLDKGKVYIELDAARSLFDLRSAQTGEILISVKC